MSAYISFPYPDHIELVTDGATCLPSGMMIADTDKVRVSPHVSLAITGRGGNKDLREVSETIIEASACGSVDDTLAAVAASLNGRPIDGTKHGLEVFIAAWSETIGPVRAYFSSFDRDDIPAWTLVDCGDGIWGGGPDFDETDVLGLGLTAGDFADGAAEGGLAIMEMMRSKPGADPTNPNGVHGYWIGGHVDHAVITRDGVTVKRIHDWGDQLFRKIEP